MLFAWPLVGLLALVDEDAVVVSEMIAVTAFLLAVDVFWWWKLVFENYAGGTRMMMGFAGWRR